MNNPANIQIVKHRLNIQAYRAKSIENMSKLFAHLQTMGNLSRSQFELLEQITHDDDTFEQVEINLTGFLEKQHLKKIRRDGKSAVPSKSNQRNITVYWYLQGWLADKQWRVGIADSIDSLSLLRYQLTLLASFSKFYDVMGVNMPLELDLQSE